MNNKILVIEDDENIRTSMKLALEDEGYTVAEAGSGEEGLENFHNSSSDLVLVDLMLPAMDGFECCRQIRHFSNVPVIVVTAKSNTHDIVAGLEAGADDYVTKPFEVKELAARIRAHLRRMQPTVVSAISQLSFGNLEILPEQGTVRIGNKEVHLTRTEFNLLLELGSNPNKVLSREELLDKVWDYDYFGDSRLVDVHIRRLRTKVESDPANPSHIITIRGLGYKFIP
ncbi:MAG: response regulator transcription factor [Actinobacteria bacterium]|nr:response regulator transcription factor [Actinomycetota bacterium]MCL6104707.1 response regulator transcription factor [Actinomycetota bacterium]